MGKTLVLAEKPSVGRELARVLGCARRGEGFLAGEKYVVTWALGHLVTLADPEAYGEQYKKWDLATLPMLPEKMELVVIKETSKQYAAVRKLLKSPEMDRLVIATDAGREGELVARWILMKAGCRLPLFRLWISSQTDRAIREGFANLRPAAAYDNLYRSAQSRAEADWYVGLNITRALTCKYNAQLSAGRVQTPTLAMIVAREEEIKSFQAREYYTVSAKAGGVTFSRRCAGSGAEKNVRTAENARIFDRAAAEQLVRTLTGRTARVTQVKKELRREAPPLLYDLTELQRDANRVYGFSAKETLSFMQRLYEEHKLLTYPRTDSRYLTSDIVPTLPERLRSIAVGPWAPFAKDVLRRGITPTKRFVDNSKVTDHHAIIPTEQFVDLSRLKSEERKIYDLVLRRFLAVLSPEFVYERTTVTAEISGETFAAHGRVVKATGWKAIYEGGSAGAGSEDAPEEEDEEAQSAEQSLPPLKAGDELRPVAAKLTAGKTRPPARYTEATLLTAMEHPGKFIEDKALRGVMDTVSGIGTPATRADIIEKLFSVGYMERRGKEIVPLDKGIQLIGLVPEDLRSPELTARWEQELSSISRGTARPDVFIGEIKRYASRLVGGVVAGTAVYRPDNLTRTPCPQCGKLLMEVSTRRGKMLVCPDRTCGYRQNLYFESGARCPKCHKKLEVHGEAEHRIYVCRCGYREKADAFARRMQNEHSGVSRAEVSRYLAGQREGTPHVSAFAAALQKAREASNSEEKADG